jgi:ribosomal protein S18 acetylase RimI-like enzyme
MALLTPLDSPEIPDNVELTQVSSHETAGAFGSVAAEAFKSFGSPAEAAVNLAHRPGMLVGPKVAAYLAHVDGRPSSCGMVIATGDVAGIYFIGTIQEARGHGLGEMMTRMTAHAGFELGARAVILQATPMAAPLYRRIGFTDFGCYANYIGTALSRESSPGPT